MKYQTLDTTLWHLMWSHVWNESINSKVQFSIIFFLSKAYLYVTLMLLSACLVVILIYLLTDLHNLIRAWVRIRRSLRTVVDWWVIPELLDKTIAMASCNTAITPLLTHWGHCSHRYVQTLEHLGSISATYQTIFDWGRLNSLCQTMYRQVINIHGTEYERWFLSHFGSGHETTLCVAYIFTSLMFSYKRSLSSMWKAFSILNHLACWKILKMRTCLCLLKYILQGKY